MYFMEPLVVPYRQPLAVPYNGPRWILFKVIKFLVILCVDGARCYGYGKSIDLASLQAAEDYGSSVGWEMNNWYRKGLKIRISKIAISKFSEKDVCSYFFKHSNKTKKPLIQVLRRSSQR